MVWIIILGIIGFVLFKFFTDVNKDNYDLEYQSLSEKFRFIVSKINDETFGGMGSVTVLDKKSFNLYETGQNQIINFTYSTGHLSITWKYKYFQKEVVHERTFENVRNLSVFEQQRIAETMISEMTEIVARHKNNVLNGI